MKQSLLLALLAICPICQAIASPTLGNYSNATVFLSGDATNTPSAGPTNAAKITISTATSFKGRLEGDPTTGVVRITNANPAGAYTVTVTAFDSAGVKTAKTFTLTITTPVTCNPVTFATAANVTVGNFPVSVAVGDFNHDGNQDLAVVNQGPGNVSILLGDGAGGFGAATNFAVGSNPLSVAVGDFNGDGKQDLAVANLSSANVSILLGDGAGGFSAASNFAVGFGPSAVAVGDFDGNGKQDLAFAVGNGLLTILLGDGTGSFGTPTTFGIPSDSSEAIAVGDFNGDGKQDVAVTKGAFVNTSPNNVVSVFLGDGAGSFGAATNFAVGNDPRSLAIGDFNGDGKQDIAAANPGSSNVSILLGDGAGGFGAAINFATGSNPISVTTGDFDGDGKQDIATANEGSGNVSILLGDGLGSFAAAVNFGVGAAPFAVAAGDFNGDGKQDLVTANLQSANVSILLRQCPGRLTNISTRLKVLTGDSVLIGGFIVSGSGNKQVLVRALGPTLSQFGVPGALADPTLELRDGSGAFLVANDNWKDTQESAIAATGKAPPNDLESAILRPLAPGNYTAIVRGNNSATGVGLVEVYDLDAAGTASSLTNISTRGFVDTGDNVMIGGFIVGGPQDSSAKVIVRALGPTLAQFGVPNVLADPTLELRDANGTLLAANDNWQETQQAEIQASGYAPPNASESAIVITRPAGNTTAIVRGKNNTTGNALVEVYALN